LESLQAVVVALTLHFSISLGTPNNTTVITSAAAIAAAVGVVPEPASSGREGGLFWGNHLTASGLMPWSACTFATKVAHSSGVTPPSSPDNDNDEEADEEDGADSTTGIAIAMKAAVSAPGSALHALSTRLTTAAGTPTVVRFLRSTCPTPSPPPSSPPRPGPYWLRLCQSTETGVHHERNEHYEAGA
jgi:hypothetical protein